MQDDPFITSYRAGVVDSQSYLWRYFLKPLLNCKIREEGKLVPIFNMLTWKEDTRLELNASVTHPQMCYENRSDGEAGDGSFLPFRHCRGSD